MTDITDEEIESFKRALEILKYSMSPPDLEFIKKLIAHYEASKDMQWVNVKGLRHPDKPLKLVMIEYFNGERFYFSSYNGTERNAGYVRRYICLPSPPTTEGKSDE